MMDRVGQLLAVPKVLPFFSKFLQNIIANASRIL